MDIKYPVENAHTLTVEETLHSLNGNASTGLSEPDAEQRSRSFGLNIYQPQKQKSIWKMLVQQFTSPIVYLLVFGASVSAYFRDFIEAIAIVAVILINALIGFFMELQARTSMNALRKMDVIKSKVIRDGKTQEIPSERITPGDLVFLEAGDVVPGDGRLIESNRLQCDESSLTGESLPSEKSTKELERDVPLGDRHNMVFKGTSIINGNGKAIITAIAGHTQLGAITSLVESSAETATPLDKRLHALSKKLIWVTLVMTAVFAATGAIQGKNWALIVETSIALAVAAIPEGLPIVATVALAFGMLLMARRNAIVKKLSSVETLGSTSVILTDKTGTLTENKIYVDTFSFPDETASVQIENNQLKFRAGLIEKNKENLEKVKLVGMLCNNASLQPGEDAKAATGDPIEVALLQLAHATGVSTEEVKAKHKRIGEVPFSSDTKVMGTLHEGPGGFFAAAKGSVEHVLERCRQIQSGPTVGDLGEDGRNSVLQESEKMAANGLRVLAFAYQERAPRENYMDHLVYAGMIGFLDPPRMDIRDALISCRKAGIKIVMITGDHPLTALNIARRTGLVDDAEQNVVTGKDLPSTESPSEEWKKKILSTAVFARTTPKQKLDIADIYQKAGNIVAMTGDGVNDAPALKKADVGIAMGLRGTQVAKETASIVLKDDSFTSIAEAVAHGREIFQNIRKFVVYLVSCNLSEIFIVTTLGFLAPASTLLPLQILFLNMITDVFPALALGVGKGDRTVMDRPPRDAKEDIITNRDWVTIAWYASGMTLAVVLAVVYCKLVIIDDQQVMNNIAFTTLTIGQLFHVFNMASPRSGLVVNEVTTNRSVWVALLICGGLLALVYLVPQLRLVLHLVDLPLSVWVTSLVAGFLPMVVVQTFRQISNRSR